MHLSRRNGLTLVELVIVMVILIALAGLLIPMLTSVSQDAQATATRANLSDLATVIGRYRADNNGSLPFPGYVGMQAPNNRPNVPQVRYLFVNPGGYTSLDPNNAYAEKTRNPLYNPFQKIGWNGPYVLSGAGSYPNPTSIDLTAQANRNLPAGQQTTYAQNGFTTIFGVGPTYGPTGKVITPGDPCVMDGWNNPIVLIQWIDTSVTPPITRAWLQSAGPDGLLAVSYSSGVFGVNINTGTATLPALVPITGPPTPVTPSNTAAPVGGSVFPTSSTSSVTVDDLTFVVQ